MQDEVRRVVRYYKGYGSHCVGDIIKHLKYSKHWELNFMRIPELLYKRWLIRVKGLPEYLSPQTLCGILPSKLHDS